MLARAQDLSANDALQVAQLLETLRMAKLILGPEFRSLRVMSKNPLQEVLQIFLFMSNLQLE